MGRLHRYFQGPIDTCMQSIAAPYASQLALFVCMCGCWAAQVNKSNCVNDVVLESVGGWAVLFHTILTPNFVTASRVVLSLLIVHGNNIAHDAVREQLIAYADLHKLL